MTQTRPCGWHRCPYWSTCQVTIPAPPFAGGRATATFCAYHERQWQRALAATCPLSGHSSTVWVNYFMGAPPLVGWGMMST